jgi:hypothetical protein
MLLATVIGGCRPAPEAVREVILVEDVALEVLFENPVALPRVVAVVLPGGFSPNQLPASGDHLLRQDVGLVQVHVELPGGEGSPTTDGDMDYHGAGSRQAVGTALRFAGGKTPSTDGFTLFEMLDMEGPLPVVLVGRSNGGNLAVATLADADVEVPEVSGLVVWETPAGPQFLLMELRDPERGACGFSELDGDGLVCEMDTTQLVDAVPPYLDRNNDGLPGDDEPVFEGLLLEEGRLHSPSLLRALSLDPGRQEVQQALDWFSWRDASRRAPLAVARQPDMGVIVLGGETDHAQYIDDSPHVFGLAQVFHAEGAWTRLLPDSVYSNLVVEQPAGQGVSLETPGTLAPTPHALTHLLTAAVLELGDRNLTGNWDDDLDTPLRDGG